MFLTCIVCLRDMLCHNVPLEGNTERITAWQRCEHKNQVAKTVAASYTLPLQSVPGPSEWLIMLFVLSVKEYYLSRIRHYF